MEIILLALAKAALLVLALVALVALVLAHRPQPYAFVGFGRGGAGGGRSRLNRAQVRTARLLRAGARATGRRVNSDRAIVRRGATITRGRRVA